MGLARLICIREVASTSSSIDINFLNSFLYLVKKAVFLLFISPHELQLSRAKFNWLILPLIAPKLGMEPSQMLSSSNYGKYDGCVAKFRF